MPQYSYLYELRFCNVLVINIKKDMNQQYERFRLITKLLKTSLPVYTLIIGVKECTFHLPFPAPSIGFYKCTAADVTPMAKTLRGHQP